MIKPATPKIMKEAGRGRLLKTFSWADLEALDLACRDEDNLDVPVLEARMRDERDLVLFFGIITHLFFLSFLKSNERTYLNFSKAPAI